MAVGGAAWGLAGDYIGLPPEQTAGNRCFGGALMIISGLLILTLLWSRDILRLVNRGIWTVASVTLFFIGVCLAGSAFRTWNESRVATEEVRAKNTREGIPAAEQTP